MWRPIQTLSPMRQGRKGGEEFTGREKVCTTYTSSSFLIITTTKFSNWVSRMETSEPVFCYANKPRFQCKASLDLAPCSSHFYTPSITN